MRKKKTTKKQAKKMGRPVGTSNFEVISKADVKVSIAKAEDSLDRIKAYVDSRPDTETFRVRKHVIKRFVEWCVDIVSGWSEHSDDDENDRAAS